MFVVDVWKALYRFVLGTLTPPARLRKPTISFHSSTTSGRSRDTVEFRGRPDVIQQHIFFRDVRFWIPHTVAWLCVHLGGFRDPFGPISVVKLLLSVN